MALFLKYKDTFIIVSKDRVNVSYRTTISEAMHFAPQHGYDYVRHDRKVYIIETRWLDALENPVSFAGMILHGISRETVPEPILSRLGV